VIYKQGILNLSTQRKTMDYRHILLAVDYSAHTDYVANKAKSLAEQYKAKLSIIHVLDNIPMPDTNYGTAISLSENTDYELLEVEKKKTQGIRSTFSD
jgi:universal stress protein A